MHGTWMGEDETGRKGCAGETRSQYCGNGHRKIAESGSLQKARIVGIATWNRLTACQRSDPGRFTLELENILRVLHDKRHDVHLF